MTTQALTASVTGLDRGEELARRARYIVPLGRVLDAAIFIIAGAGHFSEQTIQYAAQNGVPWATVAVPLSGVIAMVGGLSVALGFHTRIGALLLVLFLLPVTVIMHDFWAVGDPAMAQLQQVMFMKNLSMLGGALLLAHFGGGPFSLDALRKRRATSHP